MFSSFNLRQVISRSLWVAAWALVCSSCIKSVKDESTTNSVPSEKSAAPLNEPTVETARESSPVQIPAQLENKSTNQQASGEVVSISDVGQVAEKLYSTISAQANQPVVQTAPESSVTPPMVQGSSASVATGQIVAMRRIKRAADGKDFSGDGTPAPPAAGPTNGFSFAELMKQVILYDVEMDPRAHMVPGNPRLQFSPDPRYTAPYDPQAQLAIYGAKHPDPTARPLIEAGRELYPPGPFGPGINIIGEKNLVFPQLLVYGDWRTAIAYNSPGAVEIDKGKPVQLDKGLATTKLDLDFDLKLTGTERIHLFFTPINRAGLFTRAEFAGDELHSGVEADFEPGALFFEGDLARLWAGFSNEENKADIPFAVGLIPLLVQNGIWLNDGFDGFAVTIPARNSPMLDISNADITFFAGFDRVTSGAIASGGATKDNSADIFGAASFIEAMRGYFEIDYGYTLGRKKFDDLSYHNLSAAFTRRYFDEISNSVRVIYNVGQEPDHGEARTADGVLLLIENSLISPRPLTLVPYLDLFAGFNKPQSLARAGAAGGVLVNTGICFETDNLTGFPKMDDTGHDTWGGSFGIEYLFNLDQQIVVEISGLDVFGDPKDRTAKGSQYGVGIRYQLPLNNAWLIRADLIAAERDNDQDLFGIRAELRRKF